MGDSKVRKGKFGEEIARQFLLSLGYEIITSNFRTRIGEIDIIAKDKGDFVFVEVKMREDVDKWGLPAEAVTSKKREKMKEVALLYLQKQGVGEAGMRFEVVEVLPKLRKARLIRDLF
ncbi:YraN family protein [bacterium]|nr:YraN family protein [bacterium]